jgi:hypothetical protein
MPEIRRLIIPLSRKIIVFISVFYFVAWGTGAILSNDIFWNILSSRFDKDERYQTQSLFIPDNEVTHQIVSIGDSRFLSSLPEQIKNSDDTKQIIITRYDPDDFSNVLRGILHGWRYTNTRTCTLVFQVSPLFSLRGRSEGSTQNYTSLRYRDLNGIDPKNNGKAFFGTLKRWSNAKNTKPTLQSDPRRPKRMVAQARFASPNRENWDRAFRDIEKYKGQIIAVLDTRDTDWGENSNLIAATRDGLVNLALTHNNFNWVTLDELRRFDIPNCSNST